MIKNLIKCDVDECCMASMDKDDVIEKLEKIKKYLEEVNEKENPKDLNSALDGYY
jgi:DNA-binding phage protein